MEFEGWTVRLHRYWQELFFLCLELHGLERVFFNQAWVPDEWLNELLGGSDALDEFLLLLLLALLNLQCILVSSAEKAREKLSIVIAFMVFLIFVTILAPGASSGGAGIFNGVTHANDHV